MNIEPREGHGEWSTDKGASAHADQVLARGLDELRACEGPWLLATFQEDGIALLGNFGGEIVFPKGCGPEEQERIIRNRAVAFLEGVAEAVADAARFDAERGELS